MTLRSVKLVLIFLPLFFIFFCLVENRKNEVYTSTSTVIFEDEDRHRQPKWKREIRSTHDEKRKFEDENSDEDEDEEENRTVIVDHLVMEDSNSLETTTTINNDLLLDTTTTPEAITNDDNQDNFEIKNSVHLTVKLLIFDVADIDETSEIITMAISGNIAWNATDKVNLNHFYPSKRRKDSFLAKPTLFGKIWTPDIRFQPNAKQTKKSLVSEPSKIRYYQDVQVVWYHMIRLTLKLKCDMDFTYYPADTQKCDFKLYTYNFDRLVTMDWDYLGAKAFELTDNNFDVQLYSYERKQKVEDIKYDAFEELEFTIAMRRKISYHVVQTYLPSILYILITCLCFLVPSHMVEVRIGISMTTLLTLTAMFASVRESTPTVSYIKAIDIWMAFCIFFVFLTLLEFTTLLWLRSQREAVEKKRTENQKMLNALKSVIGGKSVGEPVPGLLERS